MKSEFPAGLVVKESVFSLLWHELDSWPKIFMWCGKQTNKQTKNQNTQNPEEFKPSLLCTK